MQTKYKEENFQNESVEMLEQVAQRGGGCPIPRSIQIQAWEGSEHPDDYIMKMSIFTSGGLD